MYSAFIETYEIFKDHGVEDPLKETLRLFDLLSKGALRDADLSFLEREKMTLPELARKRKKGVPLEYITGFATFMGYRLFCDPAVLIPRKETELLVKTGTDFIEKMQRSPGELVIIEIGTGCGNIAVSLALGSRGTRILASDINCEIVEIARKNIKKYDLEDRVFLFCGDLFSPFYGRGYEGKIDMVICNPPYIPTGSLDKLPPEVINHEPRIALDAGSYGIDIFRRLLADSIYFLKPGGILVFEIGAGQEELVTVLLKKNKGYENIKYFEYGGDIRVVSADRKLKNPAGSSSEGEDILKPSMQNSAAEKESPERGKI